MMGLVKLAGILVLSIPLTAQVFEFSREQMIKCTAKNPFGRFEDGRPKVPDSLIEKIRELSAEDCWGVLRRHQYVNQFEGNWKIIHPELKLAGRAVTAVYMPARPDLEDLVMAGLRARGFPNRGHQYVIDMLRPGDVLVADAYGKVPGFVGDNLATYIKVATKTGGLVVDGGIRDLESIHDIEVPIYCRFANPGAVTNFTLIGVNVPVRIGNVTVMPGDVVLGDREGTTFIPPELVQETVDRALEIKIHDEWTKMKLNTGRLKELGAAKR